MWGEQSRQKAQSVEMLRACLAGLNRPVGLESREWGGTGRSGHRGLTDLASLCVIAPSGCFAVTFYS